MFLEFDQQQQLKQTQTLSFKQQLSLNILQMNAVQLTQYIKEIRIENPVIELDESYDKKEVMKEKLEWLEKMNKENETYSGQQKEDQNTQNITDLNVCTTLHEHLLAQISILKLCNKQYRIMKYIILSIDEKGYLEYPLKNIARDLNVMLKEVEDALKEVQKLEPYGVGARDLNECLKIQLINTGYTNEDLFKIIGECFDDLVKNKFKIISKKLEISIDEVKKYYDIIRSLNPYPGNIYGDETIQYINPDIIVMNVNGCLDVFMNKNSPHSIQMNQYYVDLIKTSEHKETKDYILKKFNQAVWINNCLEQRTRTLLKVANCIVKYQIEFFNKGPGYLKKMRLKDVADQLSIHESTVSRAVKNKYLQCQRGIYEIQSFFSSGLVSDDEGTAENIKLKIKEIIKNENKNKPYSDEKISELLMKEDMHISRRTVAKYRNELGIFNASKRKEF